MCSDPIDRVLPPRSIIFGNSKAMREIREGVPKIARTDVPVLLHGESGTGKGTLAQLIHFSSSPSEGPFIRVNCPSIPPSPAAGDLFEDLKESYSHGDSCGSNGSGSRWGGTVLLDEVGELPPAIQAKLLRMLRDEEPSRVRDPNGNRVQVRVLCTTNRSLEREVQNGNFRGDLFYLLNVVSFRVPPLRERKEDIPSLADHFVRLYSDRFTSPAPPLNDPLLEMLVEHDWPGNIRELENVMKRYVILGTPESIMTMKRSMAAEAQAFSFDVPENGSVHLKELKRQAIRELEAKVISRVLRESRWNRKQAARTLNISYRSLLGKLRAAGLDRSEKQ